MDKTIGLQAVQAFPQPLFKSALPASHWKIKMTATQGFSSYEKPCVAT
jgi:hypothetical protein